MDAHALVGRLERFPDALEAAVAGLGGADWRWSPAAGAWSIGDVLVHLVSEETDDFRERSVFMMHEGMDGPHDFAVHLKTNDPANSDFVVRVISDWGP